MLLEQVEHLWDKLRKKLCPKRIYGYGTVSLAYFDDRTPLERQCDAVDEFFFSLRQKRRKVKSYRPQVFHSYFDYGLGKVVESMSDIKDKEKEGYVKMSFDEAERYSKKYKDEAKKKFKDRLKQSIRESLGEIKQGRSFYREIASQAPKDDKVRRARLEYMRAHSEHSR